MNPPKAPFSRQCFCTDVCFSTEHLYTIRSDVQSGSGELLSTLVMLSSWKHTSAYTKLTATIYGEIINKGTIRLRRVWNRKRKSDPTVTLWFAKAAALQHLCWQLPWNVRWLEQSPTWKMAKNMGEMEFLLKYGSTEETICSADCTN